MTKFQIQRHIGKILSSSGTLGHYCHARTWDGSFCVAYTWQRNLCKVQSLCYGCTWGESWFSILLHTNCPAIPISVPVVIETMNSSLQCWTYDVLARLNYVAALQAGYLQIVFQWPSKRGRLKKTTIQNLSEVLTEMISPQLPTQRTRLLVEGSHCPSSWILIMGLDNCTSSITYQISNVTSFSMVTLTTCWTWDWHNVQVYQQGKICRFNQVKLTSQVATHRQQKRKFLFLFLSF